MPPGSKDMVLYLLSNQNFILVSVLPLVLLLHWTKTQKTLNKKSGFLLLDTFPTAPWTSCFGTLDALAATAILCNLAIVLEEPNLQNICNYNVKFTNNLQKFTNVHC